MGSFFMDNTPINLNKARKAAEIGHNNLLSKGYILLKQGSYHTYVLEDWLPRFISAGVLVFKRGVYLPVREKINELSALNAEYQEYLSKRNYQRKLVNEEMDSLGATEKVKLNG